MTENKNIYGEYDKIFTDEEMKLFDDQEFIPEYNVEEWIESLRGDIMSSFDDILKIYPDMDKDYFHKMADIFRQLENKDQVELFRYFHHNYTTKSIDEWDIDGIMHILKKLVFEDQMEVVLFFQNLYDPN